MLLHNTIAELLDDGSLRFRFDARSRVILRVAAWREGFAATSTRGAVTEPTDPWPMVVLPQPGTERNTNPAVDAFIEEIPPEVRDVVRLYQFGQCLLLRALATAPAAVDLFAGNPNLLWLIAIGVYEGRIGSDHIAALCLQRQAELLRKLTQVGARAQVKFLRKVRVTNGWLTEGRVLHEAVRNAHLVHAVRHLPAVSINLLELLITHPRFATEAFAPLIAAKFDEAEARGPARVSELSYRLSMLDVEADDVRLRDLSAVLDGRALERRRQRRSRRLFPPPLLPGNDSIVPIASHGELEAESDSQRNCVLTYAQRMFEGRITLYRVLAPQRATLEVQKRNGSLELGELKLSGNREPSVETRHAVLDWFESHTQPPSG